jgi:D-aminoacyl-tRNA deacylase
VDKRWGYFTLVRTVAAPMVFPQLMKQNVAENVCSFAKNWSMPDFATFTQNRSMKAVIQRVTHASITISDIRISSIKEGLLVFLGIEDADTMEDLEWLSNKIVNLRIFDDADKIPNVSVKEMNGEILLVSQFTLHASTKKGNRPSYIKASKWDFALPMYDKMIVQLEKDLGKKISIGEFGADMKVSLLNNGPVTIIIDTKNKE